MGEDMPGTVGELLSYLEKEIPKPPTDFYGVMDLADERKKLEFAYLAGRRSLVDELAVRWAQQTEQ